MGFAQSARRNSLGKQARNEPSFAIEPPTYGLRYLRNCELIILFAAVITRVVQVKSPSS